MALTKIGTDGVKDDAITSGKIPANAVGSSELADNAVDTAAIAAGAVTNSKLENNSIAAGKLADSGVNSGSYGSATAIPAITVNSKGQITAASTNNVNIPAGTTINNNADNRVITGSGTANTLNGESNVVIDSSGNVGIGTTSPSDLLDVTESSASAAAATTASVAQFERAGNIGITLSTADTGDATIFFGDTASSTIGRVNYDHNDNSMQLWTNSSIRFLITSSGNVGIGTTSPDSVLNCYKSDATAYSSTASDGQVGVGPSIYLYNPANSNTTVGGQIVFGMRSTETQCRIVATGGSSPQLAFTTNDAERMRIDSSGKVGIANSIPNNFHSSGNNLVVGSGSGDEGITLYTGTGSAGCINFADGTSGSESYMGRILYRHGDNAMSFHTNTGNERMRILSGGGLTFNGDTAAANALDDYEEGTYTPTPNSGTTQTSVTDGQYTKIGNFVIVTGSISLSGNGTSGQMVNISIPFTSASGRAGSGVIRYSNASIANTITIHINSGLASMDWYQFGGSGLTYSEASTNRYDFCLTYRTT